jgi:hypothetical protein
MDNQSSFILKGSRSMNNQNDKTIQEVKQDLVNGEATHTQNVRKLEIALVKRLEETRAEDTRNRILDTLTQFPESEDVEPVALEQLVRRVERRAESTVAASSTLAASGDIRWWINLAATAGAVVLVQLGVHYAIEKISDYKIRKKSETTDGNPFTDTSAAATTHRSPRRLRPESSVSAVS